MLLMIVCCKFNLFKAIYVVDTLVASEFTTIIMLESDILILES